MSTKNIYNSDFLDILFDGRNKDYGAYDLRRSADRRVRQALIGTASIALVIVGGYVASNNLFASSKVVHDVVTTTTKLISLPPEEEEEVRKTPPPPSLPSTPPPAVSSIKNVTPTIQPDDLVRPEDEVPHLDSIGNKAIGLTTTQGDDENGSDLAALIGKPGGTGTGVIEAPSTGGGTDRPFDWVEIMPRFPGGDEALMKFLRDNVRYPRMAQESYISGTIFVSFVIDKYGTISEVKTVGAHVGAGLEEEATRVVKKMPSWKPGKQNGQTVAVQFNLPIRFQLEN
jgi:protein TonB